MTAQEITAQLQLIASAADFPARSSELTEGWALTGVDADVVEPILRFIEDHPNIDFGTPGPLVHFVERWYGKGYENKLIESVQRKPASLTIWMLNRVVNGAKSADVRRQLIEVMKIAKHHPLADEITRKRIEHFLERLSA